MRILQVGKFFPPPFGGMETVLVNMVGEFSKEASVDVVVANTSRMTEVETHGSTTVYKVGAWGTAAGTSLCPSMPALLRRLLRRGRYDIVHLHLPNPTGHFSLGWTLPKGVKLVVTWHSDIVRQKRLMKLYLPFLTRFLERADAIVAATPKNFTSSTQLDPRRFPGRLKAIPFGIDVSAFAPVPAVLERAGRIRQQYGDEIVFACGRHIYYKGFEYLIRAMATMRRGVLLLGGRGPLSAGLEALADSLGCRDRVVFLGYVPQEELPAYYHSAAVACMPSVDCSEAFGMVQLEAMACRKPVVCCELDNGVTFVNLHGETGLVTEPRNPGRLAEALETLLGDPRLRARMGEAGYRRVNSEFSLDVMRERHMALFRQLAGGREAASSESASTGLLWEARGVKAG